MPYNIHGQVEDIARSISTYGRGDLNMMGSNKMVSFADMEAIDGETSRSTLVSRNITVLGRRTSVRLEPEMWTALRDIARREACSIHDLSSLIQLRKNPDTSLTAAIRVFLMLYYRASSSEEGHQRCGHGNFNTMLARARLTLESLRACKRISEPRSAPRRTGSLQEAPLRPLRVAEITPHAATML